VPLLSDINAGQLYSDDPQKQMEAIIAQLNEWGRLISNENKTRVMKGDFSGDKSINIGELSDGAQGIELTDGTVTTTITAASIVQNDGTNDRLFMGNED
jgi:hypothetical protein